MPPHDTLAERPAAGPGLAPTDLGLGAPENSGGPGYYDVPMLKPPVWGGSISWYFFLGGLSAGAYVVGRAAERFGGPRFRPVATAGTCVAAAAVLPCAPLLIADLGDPKRFHHMLRVFKPGSPMNLGAWVLTAYHGAGAAALLREYLRWGRAGESPAARGLEAQAADGFLVAAADFAGVPLALLLASYTGVLLTGASTPVWSRNPWLPALFSAGAASAGSAAVSLALEALAAAGHGAAADAAREPLRLVHTAAHLAEVVTLVGYLSAAGRHARPLTAGPLTPALARVAAGVVGSEVLQLLPARGRARQWTGLAAAALSLYAGIALRSAVVRAGAASANDPRTKSG